ncbi:MAG: hypothetical protein ACI94Y_000357 [Maribacter sp.]|jgi:hypothetical protein
MRTLLFIFLAGSISQIYFAQFSEGFSDIEAKEMMALSSSFTFDDLFGSDKTSSLEVIKNYSLLKSKEWIINVRYFKMEKQALFASDVLLIIA